MPAKGPSALLLHQLSLAGPGLFWVGGGVRMEGGGSGGGGVPGGRQPREGVELG